VLAFVLASACLAGAAAAHAPRPSQTMRDTFTGCTWGEVKGAKLSVWSYACDAQHGNTWLVADDVLPGFKFPDGRVAIVAFTKPANAPMGAILRQVRAASPGPSSSTCVLTRLAGDHGGREVYEFVPTGAAKAQFDAWQAGANSSGDFQPPCGFMGPGQSGDRYFVALPSDPRTVVFVNAGSEIQIFDQDTIRRRR
jgi:hypothetical protein